MAWKFGKLKLMVHGPFNIIRKIGENAYNMELLDNYDILPTFNLKDLRPYHDGDMRVSLFSQLWGIDIGAFVTPQISGVFFFFFIQEFNVQLFYIPKIYKTILL